MKKFSLRLSASLPFCKGFSLLELLLALAVALVLIEVAVRISVSETRSSITTNLVQSLRGDADRIINLIRLDIAEADAVFRTDQANANCTNGGNGVQAADALLLKIRHPFIRTTSTTTAGVTTTTRVREFVFVCYFERVNAQDNQQWDLFRFGPPYGVSTATGTAFNGSNYLGSGFLDTAGASVETLVRRMTTLRPAGANPSIPAVSSDFNSVFYSLQVRSQNVVVGSIWNKAYVVPGIRVAAAGRCVAPGAAIGATNQATTRC